MRILLVEDDGLLGDGVVAGLRQTGHAVDWVRDGTSALEALTGHDYAAIVLDIGLPRLGGLEVLRRLRQRGDDTPVLLLTARDALPDRIGGLDAGADDYLTKPFALDELHARLRALSRRAGGRAQPVLAVRGLVLDPAARVATLQGQPVPLSAREFGLLQVLLENAGKVLPRDRLERSLYGWNEEVESNAVEVHVHHLRRKLGKDWIRTVRGAGYVIPRDDP